jgi:hypothetical protein
MVDTLIAVESNATDAAMEKIAGLFRRTSARDELEEP